MNYSQLPSKSSLPLNVPYNEPAPEYTEADAEYLLGHFPPPPSTLQRLALPVALPQVGTSFDAPFVRAYHHDLAASGIQQMDWLKFIDGLNIAMTASPPLRVVDLAGMVIGFVPYHWAIIAGAAMQTAAQTAMHVLSKTLTDKYLLAANKNYFEPRGLKVRLMKTGALRKFIHIDEGHEDGKFKHFAKAAGRTAQNIALHLPLRRINGAIIALSDPAPKIDPMSPDDITGRRVANLRGYIHPISFDVPPPIPPESLMDKTSALGVKLSQWKSKKAETKAMRQRRLLAVAQGRAYNNPSFASSSFHNNSNFNSPGQSSPDPASLNFSTITNFYTNRRAQREEQRVMQGGRRGQRQIKRLQHRVDKADLLEANHTDGLVWIVLLNADQDREIEGRELADTTEDERIQQDEWEEEIDLENEKDELFEMQRLSKQRADAGPSSYHKY